MAKKKPMGKPKYALWLHVGEYFLIIIGLKIIIKLKSVKQTIHRLRKEQRQIKHNIA
jgi:hypothetical protein